MNSNPAQLDALIDLLVVAVLRELEADLMVKPERAVNVQVRPDDRLPKKNDSH